jgi:chemotaxis signal transduction protein
MMPAYVRGVINLRGKVVPVIDLAVRFGRAAGDVTRPHVHRDPRDRGSKTTSWTSASSWMP